MSAKRKARTWTRWTVVCRGDELHPMDTAKMARELARDWTRQFGYLHEAIRVTVTEVLPKSRRPS